MRKKLLCSSVVVAASLFASSAGAVTNLNITGPSGTFGDDSVLCTGGAIAPCAFDFTFEFITPTGFNISSMDISSIRSSNLTNIDFNIVTFNRVDFLINQSGPRESRSLFDQSLVTGGRNFLRVSGLSGGEGAYAGTISFAQVPAIPEPATWMMMLLGFAGIGFTMRRKNKSTLQVRYT